MYRQLRPLAGLALAALLIAAPGLALAHGAGPQQTVDGYTLTLALPEQGFSTGRNPVVVSLWDWQGYTPDATVTVGLLAFTPPGDGHGDSHGEAAPAGGHAAERTDEHAADSHEATTDDHGHDATNATEGQGLALVPVVLAPSEELGEYRGELAFDEAGTYSVSIVFTIDGAERGAIFDVVVARSRPRGLVLGGFALVNALAIGSAYLIKRRTPTKAAKPARPAPATPSAPEEQPR